MAGSPSVWTTLARELPRGHWSSLTTRFWTETLTAAGILPTPSVLQTLRADFRAGQWSPTTVQTMERVVAPLTPTRQRTLAHEFHTGRFGAVTRATLEAL
jgi:hypothetical protein